jgi:hypothetical protein
MNKERKAIPKKVRFEVFKRDAFSCQYCGATPPAVILHVDHINPVSKGGKNNIDNLVTSCNTCNIGKGATLLTSVPKSLKEKAAEIKEREEQIREFNLIIQQQSERLEVETWNVINALEGCVMDNYPKQDFQSVKRFLQMLPYHEVLDAAERSCGKFRSGNHDFRYFCGICWNKIKEQKNS